jgi:hypothetical protein
MTTIRTSLIRFKVAMATLMALSAPFVVFAQQPQADFGAVGKTASAFLGFLNGYVVPLLLAVAFLVFIWGMFKFFVQGGASEESRGEGKKLALWAVLGFVLIVSLWGIANVVADGFGFRSPALQTVPAIPIPHRSGMGAPPDCGAAC